MWGFEDEPTWELLRVPQLHVGSERLREVGVA